MKVYVLYGFEMGTITPVIDSVFTMRVEALNRRLELLSNPELGMKAVRVVEKTLDQV